MVDWGIWIDMYMLDTEYSQPMRWACSGTIEQVKISLGWLAILLFRLFSCIHDTNWGVIEKYTVLNQWVQYNNALFAMHCSIETRSYYEQL